MTRQKTTKKNNVREDTHNAQIPINIIRLWSGQLSVT